ncbi:MAG: hypothetical protein GY894_09650 [Planctomycetes bacterium]|nr:hypothetical protein [Planctomycetota bacterium]
MFHCALLIVSLASSTDVPGWCQEILRDIGTGRMEWSSSELLARIPMDVPGGGRNQPLADQLFNAWNAARDTPPVTVDDVQAIFSAKRDAIESIDVLYQSSLRTESDPSAGQPGRASVWWTWWRQDGDWLVRQVARGRPGLAQPADDAGAMRWQSDRNRVWFARLDDKLQEIPVDSVPMLGVEDSWLGAGGCIGRRWDGTARAVEHDLASLLERLPKGTAIVESATLQLDDREVAVLRIGWRTPFWLYLDIGRGFAPMRIDRVMDDEHGPMLARTDLSDFKQCAGLWLPRQIRLRQYRLTTTRFGPGDRPTSPAYLELDLQAEHISVNEGIQWGTSLVRSGGLRPGLTGVKAAH